MNLSGSGARVGAQLTRLAYKPDSRSVYACVRDLTWPVWLDSGSPHAAGGRYDFISADPYATLLSHEGVCHLNGVPLPRRVGGCNPLVALREVMGERSRPFPGLPFSGGAIGYLGYDLVRSLGQLPPRAGLDGWPDMAVGVYDWVVLVDHATRRSYFVRHGRDPRPADTAQRVLQRLQQVDANAVFLAPAPVQAQLIDGGTRAADYADGFARIQRYIRDGDCYQVNYAQCFRARTGQDAWSLYQRMREDNPAPYGALLEYPFGQVLSSSPEQFLGLRGDRVQTRPIKGTRPRGANTAEDSALRAQLETSAKDRAENVMIVDLLRNDLGKVCEVGTVGVPRLFEIESFATVHHLVSTVTGRLRRDRDAVDLIAACFPGGSITGAPKRRAMQIIDELEAVRRELYCGSVLRLGFDGDLDSSIAIRSVLKRGDELRYWAGGGIVADSDCDAEYQESLDKAAAFLRLIGAAAA